MARFLVLVFSVFHLGYIIHTCFLEQLWDLRTKTAVMDMKENEDYISDMAVDDQQKFLLATRYNTYIHELIDIPDAIGKYMYICKY